MLSVFQITPKENKLNVSEKMNTMLNELGLTAIPPTPENLLRVTSSVPGSCTMQEFRSAHALLNKGLLYLNAERIYLLGTFVVLVSPHLSSISAMLSWDNRMAKVHLEDRLNELASAINYHGAKSMRIPLTNIWLVHLVV